MPPGGKRPGAGRPKGTGGWDKERARQKLRELVFAAQDAMVEAQIAHARGIKYLVVRSKRGGTFKPVQDVQEALKKGAARDDIIEVWEKEPSTQAFTDLMNRTIDKPSEQVKTDVRGAITIRWKDEDEE